MVDVGDDGEIPHSLLGDHPGNDTGGSADPTHEDPADPTREEPADAPLLPWRLRSAGSLAAARIDRIEVLVANTKSAIKRVRQNARRVAVNAPRRTAAKTYVAKALRLAGGSGDGDPGVALAEAMSALDRAAKSGAIHPNAAARRKSRLARKVNAVLGGEQIHAGRTRATGKATAAKAARARVTASKARTTAGPKTAAGKARVALTRTTAGKAPATADKAKTTAKAATTTTARKAAPKKPTPKKATSKREG
jgi:small subunit ribosomal protein S20